MLDKAASLNPPGVDELVRRWQCDHDERARDKLIRLYMPSIRRTALRWARRWRVSPDDAIQEGSIGFIHALSKYDASIAPLDAYAGIWVRSKVGRARHAEMAMTFPAHTFNDTAKVGSAAQRLHLKLDRQPTEEEISVATGLSKRRTKNALAARSMHVAVVSFDTPLLGDGSLTLGDTIADEEDQRPDLMVEAASLAASARSAFEAVLATLVPRHEEAIRLRLVDGLTLEEVGRRMGVTRERVRQIELKVLPRLREALFDHPAVAELLGREAPEEDADDDTGMLLSISEVEQRTGLDRDSITDLIGRGAFPRSVAKDNRGNRLWREPMVERWLCRGSGDPRRSGSCVTPHS